jgi:hypothetical protein
VVAKQGYPTLGEIYSHSSDITQKYVPRGITPDLVKRNIFQENLLGYQSPR